MWNTQSFSTPDQIWRSLPAVAESLSGYVIRHTTSSDSRRGPWRRSVGLTWKGRPGRFDFQLQQLWVQYLPTCLRSLCCIESGGVKQCRRPVFVGRRVVIVARCSNAICPLGLLLRALNGFKTRGIIPPLSSLICNSLCRPFAPRTMPNKRLLPSKPDFWKWGLRTKGKGVK